MTSAVSSALRIAEVRRVSHARAADRVGGTTQFEFLVAEVPHPDRLVPGEGGGSLPGQQGLGSCDRPVGVPVAETGVDDAATRDDPEARVTARASERPGGDPVHAAHVAGEEGGDEVEPESGGEIRNPDELLEQRAVDPVRGGLEVFPGQEHPHRVEAAGGDPCKVGFDLCRLEARPPAHRGPRRPVVDADPEALCLRSRAQWSASCASRWSSTTR